MNQPLSRYQPDLPQEAQELPAGEGEYQNPFPWVQRDYNVKEEPNGEKQWYARDWSDFEFPMVMAKTKYHGGRDQRHGDENIR